MMHASFASPRLAQLRPVLAIWSRPAALAFCPYGVDHSRSQKLRKKVRQQIERHCFTAARSRSTQGGCQCKACVGSDLAWAGLI